MIDIHSHLLPGVDDGSRSIESSVAVLERFGRHGVELVVLTPHLDASRAASAPLARNREILAELQAAAPSVPELVLGWEIMLDQPGAELNAEHLRLGGAPAILVEFPRSGLPMGHAEELWRLRMSGVVPVVAHPERYNGCTPDVVRSWRNAGAAIQTDATMLLGGGHVGQLGKALLAEGLIDILASDNHADSRSLAPARDWLTEMGAGEQADLLTRINARRLLDGQPVLPVAPVVTERGMLRRLRELVFGRRQATSPST